MESFFYGKEQTELSVLGTKSGYQCRSRKESEVFGWSRCRNPNNARSRSRSRNVLSDSGSPIDLFFHHTSKLGIPIEMVQFRLKILKQRILPVYHDFH